MYACLIISNIAYYEEKLPSPLGEGLGMRWSERIIFPVSLIRAPPAK